MTRMIMADDSVPGVMYMYNIVNFITNMTYDSRKYYSISQTTIVA